jgi:peptidyl-prolyl cis-trans isomerase SurA
VDTPASSDDQGPVATVNGEEITRADFDDQFSQVEASYAQQGVPLPAGPELAQIQQQIVTQLVQQELVLQESETRGMTATDEEIDAQYQAARSSFPDEETFNKALETEGLTQDEMKGLIADNIKITKLLDSVIQQAQLAPPTEEELHQLYDLASQQQELPPFEEVRPQLEAELKSQRENEVLQAFVQELEAAGNVEILWRS